MKRTLLLIAISVIAFKSQAQTEAGKFMLGGGGLYSSSKTNSNDISNKTWAVIPQAGYFVKNNLAVGAMVGYQVQKYTQQNALGGLIEMNRMKEGGFTVSPFARYYKNITEQFKFFGQLSVPMYFGSSKRGDENGNDYLKLSSNKSIGVSLSPGFAYFPTKKVGIEFSVDGIRYNHNSSTSDLTTPASKTSGNQFDIGANLIAPRIGIFFYL